MTPARSVAGQVVVVTGAASGMGRATAELFAAEGARVAACDIAANELDVVVSGIVDDGGQAKAYAFDLADASAIDSMVAAVRVDLGPIDIVVNNAGVSVGAPVDAEEYEESWFAALDVNVTAQVRLIRACLDDLRRHRSGRIINVASTEGIGGSARTSPYTASKHAVVGLTRSLAIELGPDGITVNCVCPGPINTGMTAAIPDEAKATFARRRTGLRRYGESIEVAHMTLSLALPAMSYVTGAIIPVDGGMSARNN